MGKGFCEIFCLLLVKLLDLLTITTEEATDVRGTEQLNLAIRWISYHYKAHEGSVVFSVPDIKSETLFGGIKDLIMCDLPLELCRG